MWRSKIHPGWLCPGSSGAAGCCMRLDLSPATPSVAIPAPPPCAPPPLAYGWTAGVPARRPHRDTPTMPHHPACCIEPLTQRLCRLRRRLSLQGPSLTAHRALGRRRVSSSLGQELEVRLRTRATYGTSPTVTSSCAHGSWPKKASAATVPPERRHLSALPTTGEGLAGPLVHSGDVAGGVGQSRVLHDPCLSA